MKVLAISSSPRRGGNSDVLCDEFLKGAAERGHETLADFRSFLHCLPGAREAGVIFGTGTWDKGDVYRHPSLKQVYEMERRFDKWNILR